MKNHNNIIVMGVIKIMYREDYYKFAHHFFPYTVFKYPKALINNIIMNKDMFAKNMTLQWGKIPLKNSTCRNKAPIFKIELIKVNENISLIVIKVPTAKEELEAYYMGVSYDKNYNIRYFTYEIAKGFKDNALYAMCEWTPAWDHINYGLYSDNNITTFTNNVESVYNNLVLSAMTFQ